jgi:hypothetical protein
MKGQDTICPTGGPDNPSCPSPMQRMPDPTSAWPNVDMHQTQEG